MPTIRSDRIAIALDDIDRIDESMRVNLLAGKVELRTVDCNGIACIVFKCDTLVAATIVDILRGNDRAVGDDTTRVFLDRGNGWQSIKPHITLTTVVDGKVMLIPSVFGTKVKAVPPKAIKVM